VFALGDKPAKMMREDLAAAGITYRDGAGRVADFHSLRHTYISNIQRNGASVKVCQELARHSDPKLTLGVYTHLQVQDKTAALDALPPVGADRSGREATQATGTFDVKPDRPFDASDGRAAHAQRAGAPKGGSVLSHATGTRETQGARKPLQSKRKHAISNEDDVSARVAQLDRASVYGTEGYRFESCRAWCCGKLRRTGLWGVLIPSDGAFGVWGHSHTENHRPGGSPAGSRGQSGRQSHLRPPRSRWRTPGTGASAGRLPCLAGPGGCRRSTSSADRNASRVLGLP